MKSSRYVFTAENPTNGDLLVFSTLYGSTARVSAADKPTVLRLLDQPVQGAAGSHADAGLFETMVRLKFLVEDDLDELDIVRRRKRAGIEDRNRLDVILMPTLACNFACPYCYENHDSAEAMGDGTRARVAKWLTATIAGCNVLVLNWFGGEPLLCPETVLALTAHARQECLRHGAHFMPHITTNGYLLTSDLAAQLVAAGITNFQITIDGPPTTHNLTRPLRSGGPTFDIIFDNVVGLVRSDQRVRVSLRVNYNHTNIDAIPELLHLFPEDVRPQLRLVCEPIFGASDLSATKNMSGAEISERIAGCYALARSLGYDLRLGGLGVGKLVYCYAERRGQYVVDARGDVFKCTVSQFRHEDRLGTLDADGTLVRDDAKWAQWFGAALFEDKCDDCVFLPLCMGGCRKDRVAHGQTGSYCSLVPTNTSQVLKSIAFGVFGETLEADVDRCRGSGKGKSRGR